MLRNGGQMIYAIKCAMHLVSNMEKKAKEVKRPDELSQGFRSHGLASGVPP